jgi:hypothetical protein
MVPISSASYITNGKPRMKHLRNYLLWAGIATAMAMVYPSSQTIAQQLKFEVATVKPAARDNLDSFFTCVSFQIVLNH